LLVRVRELGGGLVNNEPACWCPIQLSDKLTLDAVMVE